MYANLKFCLSVLSILRTRFTSSRIEMYLKWSKTRKHINTEHHIGLYLVLESYKKVASSRVHFQYACKYSNHKILNIYALQQESSSRIFWDFQEAFYRGLILWTVVFHFLKNVRLQSFSCQYFPAFGLNAVIYFINIVFSPNAGKYGPEKLRMRTLFTQCSPAIVWGKCICEYLFLIH